MTNEIRELQTLHVATAATGIGLAPDVTFSDVQRVFDHALGYNIWTHELADHELCKKAADELYRQFPELPTKAQAISNHIRAADLAVKVYGDTLKVAKGNHTREEGPVESLTRLRGSSEGIVVVTVDEKN